jgi:hypothetical protein
MGWEARITLKMPLTPARVWRIKGKARANLLRYEALARLP